MKKNGGKKKEGRKKICCVFGKLKSERKDLLYLNEGGLILFC